MDKELRYIESDSDNLMRSFGIILTWSSFHLTMDYFDGLVDLSDNPGRPARYTGTPHKKWQRVELSWETALELDELLLLMRLPLCAPSGCVLDGISRTLKISAVPQQLELHWHEFGENAPLHWGCLKELTTYLRKLVTSRFKKKLRSEDPYFSP